MKWILPAILLLYSCSPQQRLQRLTHRHPALITTLVNDTTYMDTLHLQAWSVDTMKVTNTTDTIVIRHDSTVTVVYRHHDTLRVHTSAADHYVVQPVEVREKIKVIKEMYGINWTKVIRWIALAIIAICAAVAGTKIASKLNLKSIISG